MWASVAHAVLGAPAHAWAKAIVRRDAELARPVGIQERESRGLRRRQRIEHPPAPAPGSVRHRIDRERRPEHRRGLDDRAHAGSQLADARGHHLLHAARDALRGRGRLTEENVADTLRQVRMALLEADVAVPVVKAFTDAARARAIGSEVMKSLTPGQAFIGVIHEELTRVMGEAGRGLELRAAPPVVVVMWKWFSE